MDRKANERRSTAAAGIVLGVGMGGFVDGIVLHQIFQVHNMISAKVPPNTMGNMERGMVADGLFHAGTWVVTMIGIALLWRALTGQGQGEGRGHGQSEGRAYGAAFSGHLLAGWGWFNLVEGIVDHHLLGLHHVIERLGVSVWDWLFLASGVALIVAGHLIGRSSAHRS